MHESPRGWTRSGQSSRPRHRSNRRPALPEAGRAVAPLERLSRQVPGIDSCFEVERCSHGAHHGGLAVEAGALPKPHERLDAGAVSSDEVSELEPLELA